jgi:hypothetical protein
MVARRVLAALALALTGCSGTTEPPASLVGRFDAFWSTFDAQYSYFAYKHINWDSLRAAFRPRAAAAGSQDELVAILKEMTAPLRDIHVAFTTPSGARQPTYVPAAPRNWDRTVWLQTASACHLTQVKPNLGYCTMGSIAYIVIGSWNPSQFGRDDLDAIVDRFRDAPAMIIEVRPNGGGSDALAFDLASRFVARSTVVGYVRFRNGPRHDDFTPEMTRRIEPRGAFQYAKPVIVLSGRGVFSSNESFISAMRETPNVTILGDTTGGGTGNPGEHELGDGWKYTVSRWIEWTADRRVIEWQGIPPDVVVPWDTAAVRAGRDVVLEAALSLLTTGTLRSAPGGAVAEPHPIKNPHYGSLCSSTRRFCARPSGVELGATGTSSPYPREVSRSALTPPAIK